MYSFTAYNIVRMKYNYQEITIYTMTNLLNYIELPYKKLSSSYHNFHD